MSAYTNQSLRYQDAGPEPDTSDFRDPQRWTKWNAWHRRATNLSCWSLCEIDADGRVTYQPLLRSQRTRARRFGVGRAIGVPRGSRQGRMEPCAS